MIIKIELSWLTFVEVEEFWKFYQIERGGLAYNSGSYNRISFNPNKSFKSKEHLKPTILVLDCFICLVYAMEQLSKQDLW